MDFSLAKVKERREHPRLNTRFPFRYHLFPPSKKFSNIKRSWRGVLGCDIGKGGIRFASQRFIPKYSKLLIENPPLSPYWRIIARVCWVQKMAYNERYTIGLSFQNGNKQAEKIFSLYAE
ncbi:MAG: PilZ domain-containing protein [Candidatus Omnitrophica bacterium]|nr:PilZ domain-containing protein [Candidatus Omnitrophota bacterium]